jgi:hypothetical protein
VRWKPFRITESWAKVAYILIAWMLVPTAVRFLLGQVGIPDPVILAVDLVLGFTVVGFGSRVFRARGEAVEPPRVWWRATGRPGAGFAIFALFVVAGLGYFVPPTTAYDPSQWWYLASSVPIGAFYLHSSIRLVRGDAPVPPRPRKNDDLKLIDLRRRF